MSGQDGVGNPLMDTCRSWSVRTSYQPKAAASAEVTMTAITSPSEPTGVRSSSTINPTVARPIATFCQWSFPGASTVLTARATRLDPGAEYPVRFSS